MKNKSLIFLLFFFAAIINTSAQNTFQQTIGDASHNYAQDTKQTSDSGFIMVGNSNYNTTDEEIIIGKVDMYGAIQWANSIGSSQVDEVASSIEITSDGGYIIAGTRDSGSSSYDIIMVKTDGFGTVQWSKFFGDTDLDVAYGIHQTLDGGFLLNGMTTNPASGNYSTYLIKTDVNGSTQWSKTYSESPMGVMNSCKQMADSSFIVCGTHRPFGPIHWDFIFKADVSGNLQWFKLFSSNLSDISQTIDGGFIAAGFDSAVNLIKLNNAGNIQWAKSFYDTAAHSIISKTVSQTTDGGYLISGMPSNAQYAFLIKTDSIGSLQWSKKYLQGSSGSDGDIVSQQTFDGGYVMGSTSYYNGDDDFILIKTDASGNSGCYDTTGVYIVSSVTVLDSILMVIPVSTGNDSTLSLTAINLSPSINVICSSTSLNEIESNNLFSIFPNPTSSTFTIASTYQLRNARIAIYNLIGDRMYAGIYDEKLTLSCELFAKGIYFVQVIADEKRSIQKLIIQ